MAIEVGYDYVNARLHAMRSRLLDPETLEQLLASPNLQALIGRLDQNVYHAALEQALSTSSGLPAILRAVRLHHSQVTRRIITFGGETTGPALAILLAPYHRETVVTLLRGIYGGWAPDHILAWMFDLPPFSEALLAELARQGTVREAVDLLVQWQLPSPALTAKLVGLRPADSDLRDLTTAFDLAWAESVSGQAERLNAPDADVLRLDLARLIDLLNLLNGLNLQGIELALAPSWLPGGLLAPEVLEAIRSASGTEAMDAALAVARGGEFWRHGLQQWDGERTTTLQRLWEADLLRWRLSLFAGADPLGVGVLIALVAAQSAEARNLRLIAEAVAGSIDREDARTQFALLK